MSDFCDPMGCSPPVSSVHGISQARILAAATAAKLLQSCPTLCDPMDCSLENTGVGCYFLLHGIFLDQGLNSLLLGLLHCRWILYHCAIWAG